MNLPPTVISSEEDPLISLQGSESLAANAEWGLLEDGYYLDQANNKFLLIKTMPAQGNQARARAYLHGTLYLGERGNYYSGELLYLLNIENNRIIQNISFDDSYLAMPWREYNIELCGYIEYDLVFQDVNFDGYLDLSILQYPGQHMKYAYWIWNPEKGLFLYDEELNSLELLDAVFLADKESIVSYMRDGAMNWTESIYKYIDGKPTLIKEVNCVSDNSIGIAYITTKELIDGELRITKEETEIYEEAEP